VTTLPLAADTGFTFADTFAVGLLFVGVAVFAAVGAMSHEEERAFSASLIYLGLGAVAAVAIHLFGIPWLEPTKDSVVVEHIVEVVVLFALFSSGLKLDRQLRWREWTTVTRLLAITMPLTIAAVALLASTLLGLSLAAAVVLAAVLAPTDPVLAGDIGVGPPGDEEEHEPNFAITAEAGLNDGLAFPFVLLGLFIAKESGAGWLGEWLAADVFYAIGMGIAVGAGAGLAAAWSVKRLHDHKLLSADFDGFHAIATTLLIYGLAEAAGGYGFLAVFAGGLAFRRYERDHEANERVHRGAEQVEKFLELAAILLLGSMLTLEGLGTPGWEGWLLVAALLLVIRPLASVVGLLGSRVEGLGEKAFVGWFGVRGVGTLYYVAFAVSAGALAPAEESLVVWTAFACVVVSIVVHGITGGPALRLLFAGLREEERDAADPPLRPRPAPEPATPRAR
jgi:NhaP-type Na+/H+ or K+/H+ antiporter